MNVAITISIFLYKQNDSLCFQLYSNKAEKFDYVSSVPWILKT